MRNPRRDGTAARTTTMAVVALLAFAGCASGEAGRPAAQILADAQAAARAADSVHISGTVAHGTTAGGPAGTATIDLLLTSSGDGREQITGAGQNIDLIKVGSVLYVKGLTSGGAPGAYQRLGLSDPRAAPLAAQLDKKSVFDQLIKTGDAASVTGSDTVGGQAAVKITPAGGVGTLYVADDAAHPYPLKVETAAAGTGQAGVAGALLFTDWNAHTVIAPPAGAGS